ncbi:taf2 [[Candida] subhashii]|uniref:Transcription initiation factor TFIID subunit 2 n=1 Tax=[Candida] subhashii TaxID=561895 RepID=A0A8J5UJ63_9ASCO|nr:taf2 [[Candida] subhashii]KAG7664263.1 taf2 [[Candida] subhashii]
MPSMSSTSTHMENLLASNSGTPRFFQQQTPRSIRGVVGGGTSSKGKLQNLSNQLLKVGHQRVNIDVDLSTNSIEGFTELMVIPTSNTLRTIKLDCREMEIKDVFINGIKNVNYVYKDMLYINDEDHFQQKYNIFDLYSDTFNIHQHHYLRSKLDYIFGSMNYDNNLHDTINGGDSQELHIILPENMKFELTDISAIQTPTGSHPGTMTPSHLRSKATVSDMYTPIQLKIIYSLKNPNNGVNFITNNDIDRKSWHAYTRNSDYNVSTSSWVPCIDNLWDRNTWSLEVNIPRTVRDIGNPRIIGSKEAIRFARNKNKRHQDDIDEEDGGASGGGDDDDIDNYDLVVCSGDFNNVKETPHPIDLSKKVVSWSVFNPVCAHHVGWALGCFSSFTLSDSIEGQGTKSDQDDASGEPNEYEEKESTYSPVTVYALPHHIELARNTCIMANKAIDYFSKEFGSFPFSSFCIVFVKFSPLQSNGFAGLSILSTDLLYPPDIIEPMFTSTEVLLTSIATQWSGINIAPQTFNDMWCTIGISHFMANSYIKKLMGTNEYRYKIKRAIDELVIQDTDSNGKKPLGIQFYRFPISETDLDFVKLKSPIVLYILDNRMTKTDKSFGLSRVLPKLFLQAMSGELPNGTISTSHFQYVCEKVNRNKLDNFFKQWVYATGTPTLRINQKFNKKKTMIEMNIRQTQYHAKRTAAPATTTNPRSFIDEAVSYLDDDPNFPIQPVFMGPLTIRVHEADGTPYEHIVDLKESSTRIDVQYNSKFRKKKKDELAAAAANPDPITPNPSSFVYRLGDVLSSESEMSDWGLVNFEKPDDEISMYHDPYEWIRADVDFEWIARIDVQMPEYMYASQLQFDRDLEAQLDAVRYFGELEKPGLVHATVLIRTVMDERYFYGVRLAAAEALARFSNDGNGFLGVGYLVRAYKELYCFPGSSIPKSNDFSDFRKYFLQIGIPQILSTVRNQDGEVPFVIKELLLNLVKFNDNTNNSFQDSIYISKLLESLTTTAITTSVHSREKTSASVFANNVVTEINRLHKLDRWTPSYQNIIEIACIKQKIRMALAGTIDLSFEDLVYLTQDKYPMEARVEAFRGILQLGGLRNASILRFFLHVVLLNFARPLYRIKLIQVLIDSICYAAMDGGRSKLDDPEFKTLDKLPKERGVGGGAGGGGVAEMIIIEEGPRSEMDSRRDIYARATIKGAIELLRRDYSIGKGLKSTMWELLHSSLLSLHEKRNLFMIRQILYCEIDSFLVSIPVPSLPVAEFKKKIVAKNLGGGVVMLKREGRFRIQLPTRKSISSATTTAGAPSTAAPGQPGSRRGSKTKMGEHPPIEQIVDVGGGSGPQKLKLSISLKSTVSPDKEKQKEVRRSSISKKMKIHEPKVFINKGFVTFKIPKHKLARISHSRPPSRIVNHHVAVRGSLVTLRFGKEAMNKVSRLMAPPVVHRYVKISTKLKTIEISTEPFKPVVQKEPMQPKVETPSISQPIEEEIKKENVIPKATEPEKLPIIEEKRAASEIPPPKSNEHKDITSQRAKSESPKSKQEEVNVSEKSNLFERSTSLPSVPPSAPKSRASSTEPLVDSKKSTPFSRGASPFTISPSPHTKKKKTKIYIHGSGGSSDSKRSRNGTSSPEN